eukprot:1637955-Rhodomonas_salina.1
MCDCWGSGAVGRQADGGHAPATRCDPAVDAAATNSKRQQETSAESSSTATIQSQQIKDRDDHDSFRFVSAHALPEKKGVAFDSFLVLCVFSGSQSSGHPRNCASSPGSGASYV